MFFNITPRERVISENLVVEIALVSLYSRKPRGHVVKDTIISLGAILFRNLDVTTYS